MVFGFLLKKKKKNGPKKGLASATGKKPAKRPKKIKKPTIKKNAVKEVGVGKAIHYFPKVKAAVIKITKGGISNGDLLHIKGQTTDFIQKVSSMQIDKKPIKKGKKGQEVGLRVKSKTRRHDKVYKITRP